MRQASQLPGVTLQETGNGHSGAAIFVTYGPDSAGMSMASYQLAQCESDLFAAYPAQGKRRALQQPVQASDRTTPRFNTQIRRMVVSGQGAGPVIRNDSLIPPCCMRLGA